MGESTIIMFIALIYNDLVLIEVECSCFLGRSLRRQAFNMSTLYILKNQHGYFLQKANAEKTGKMAYIWGDGQELNKIFKTPHKDEAINMMFENGSQDIELRISIHDYPANPKGLPIIPAEDMPTPLVMTEESAGECIAEKTADTDIEPIATENATV